MKLYFMPGACSLASHIALVWSGASFELARLSHADLGGHAYRRINPKGAVPALQLEDGSVLTESLAVLEYIGDSFPESRLSVPAADIENRAKLNERLAELATEVHKAWGPIFAPQRYVTRSEYQEDAKLAANRQLHEKYMRLNKQMTGKDWALFDRRTVVDAYLYVMCAWKDKSANPLAEYRALEAYKRRLDEDEGVRRALRAETAESTSGTAHRQTASG